MSNIRWGRIVLAAILLEVAIFNALRTIGCVAGAMYRGTRVQ